MINSNLKSKAAKITWSIIRKTGYSCKAAINCARDQIKNPRIGGQLYLVSFFKKSDGTKTSRIRAFADYPVTSGDSAQTFWSASDRRFRRYIPDLLHKTQPIGKTASLAA